MHSNLSPSPNHFHNLCCSLNNPPSNLQSSRLSDLFSRLKRIYKPLYNQRIACLLLVSLNHTVNPHSCLLTPRVESHKHSHINQLSCKSNHGSEAHHLARIQQRSLTFSILPSRLVLRSVLDAFFTSFLQRGIIQLKAFWFQAKASGISDEWFRAAINSLPRGVWESVMVQANQSAPTLDAPAPTNVPQQRASTIPGPNVQVVSAQPPPTITPLVQMTAATQQAAKHSASTEGRVTVSTPGHTSGPYAAQLQYYAKHATKSALPAQVARVSTTPPGNIAATQKTVATPRRDVPQARADVRTPKDANKSTLARDILRSLGKIVPNAYQEIGGEPTDNHEVDQLPEVNTSQPVSLMFSPKPPAVTPGTSVVRANSPPIPSANSNVQVEPQHVAFPNPSIAKSVLKEECGRPSVIQGPIMIDLTLEDSDDSVDGKGQEPEPTFPIQTSTSAATSSQPVSPSNTTNHTPLLENLSLEEPPVDFAADGDNADVRMYSPSLPLATEENMESELVYPPLGGAEPVSPSFEPLPREASEHPLDGQLPLFLPSPPVSPAHTEPPGTDLEMINDEGRGRPSFKRRSVNVDEMEIDTELVTPPRARKRRKLQVYVLVPPAPLYVKRAIKKTKEHTMGKDIDSDVEGVEEDEECMRAFLASADL